MSYQVIARKYRPQTFADLTGQEHITRTLSHALDGDRLHHAYLFSGVRGTGKTTTARILAKCLNCHQGTGSQPCLKCPSCLEITSGSSMDVLEIDAASNTGVDNVRDVIINNIAMAPARDRFKVFVIDEVHMLSTSAFNALLKTLEEPPAHVIFILATTELHKLPDTILSRCQQFEFRNIPTEKIFGRLREIAELEKVTITDNALREIARAGAGSLRDAQSAFDQVIAFSGETISEEDVTSALGLVSAATLAEFTAAISRQDTARLLELVGEVYARGYDARNFTRELMTCFRNLLLIQSGVFNGEILGVTEVEIAGLKELAPLFSEADLVRSFHLLAATEKEIKDAAEPRYQLEMGLVKLAQLRRLRPLQELLTRLEELEQRLASRGGGEPPLAPASPPPPAPFTSPGAPRGGGAPPVSGTEPAGTPAASLPPVTTSPAALPVPPPPGLGAGRSSGLTPPPPVSRRLPPPMPAPPRNLAPPRPPAPPAGRNPEPPDSEPIFDSEPADAPEYLPGDGPDEPGGSNWPARPISAARPEAPGQSDLGTDRFDPTRRRATPPDQRGPAPAPVPPPAGERATPSETGSGEVTAILAELQRNNRGLILGALDCASLEFRNGTLIATFERDDVFAKRLRESSALFAGIGETLFGAPTRIEVRIDATGGPRAGLSEAAQREIEREKLHQRARSIPAVSEFLERTRGEIVRVRELSR